MQTAGSEKRNDLNMTFGTFSSLILISIQRVWNIIYKKQCNIASVRLCHVAPI